MNYAKLNTILLGLILMFAVATFWTLRDMYFVCGGVGSYSTHPRVSSGSSPMRFVASASGLKGHTQVGARPTSRARA